MALPASAETPHVPEEHPEAHEARRADALSLVAELALANASATTKSAERYQLTLHVSADALHVSAEAPERGACNRAASDHASYAHIHDGPGLSAETARRLACDASLTSFTENADGELLNVGRKTRTIPSALRRALQARDERCRFPGCNAHRFVDAHHIPHWADGGETKLDNLVMLCRFHHRLLHEDGYVLVLRRSQLAARSKRRSPGPRCVQRGLDPED